MHAARPMTSAGPNTVSTIYTTYTYNKCLYNNDIKECNIYRFYKEDIIKCQDINKNKNYFEKKFGKDLV